MFVSGVKNGHGYYFHSRQELPALPARRGPGSMVLCHLRAPCLPADFRLRQVRQAGADISSSARFRSPPNVESSTTAPATNSPCRCWWIPHSPFPPKSKIFPTAISLITRITGDDYHVVLADCRAHKTFCWVARKANDETIERINSLKLQGIHFQKEPKRFYPARDLAAQVLGSVGMEDNGLSGIEHAYDDELRGKPGQDVDLGRCPSANGSARRREAA